MKKHLVLLVVMMLSMGVQAGEVLYAEVDGANMTLKCGDSVELNGETTIVQGAQLEIRNN